MDNELEDPERDLSKIREIKLDNNVLRIKAEDPYGFWSVSFEKGQVPKELSGVWTSVDRAMIAITNYLNKKNRKPESLTV